MSKDGKRKKQNDDIFTVEAIHGRRCNKQTVQYHLQASLLQSTFLIYQYIIREGQSII